MSIGTNLTEDQKSEEDETFKRLKRWTFEELEAYDWKVSASWEEIEAKSGWTYEQWDRAYKIKYNESDLA